jgi:serine/threonine-protein kinase
LVVDWGLAKAVGRADPSLGEQTIAPSSSGSSETLPGSALGTPAYMSPEQAAGDLHRLSSRSDVYSLGATLYCLLTGKPPFEGEGVGEILRKVQDGDFRAPREVDPALDKALEAVCLKAMATKSQDRYASCRVLAEDVERWTADLPVTAYPEPWARTLVRWLTRHRTGVTGVAAAVLAGVLGLSAVLAVQTRANALLSASLRRETKASAGLAAANANLEDERTKAENRFELAQKAIATFHTGVSEDMLLKNAEFKELRAKLLKEAAVFYADLEKLLAGQTDAKSRQTLAAAYFQLGELTGNLGDEKEALAVHRRALALRRELTVADGADVAARLDVARSLGKVGAMLFTATSDHAEAEATIEEQRDLAERLGAEHPTDAVRSVVALSHDGIGRVLWSRGKRQEALVSYRKALAIRQRLADADPAVTEYQSDLARSYQWLGYLVLEMGKLEEALELLQKAVDLYQRLVDANPAIFQFQSELVISQHTLADTSFRLGKPEQALQVSAKALAIAQKSADAYHGVTRCQQELAGSYQNMGNFLNSAGKRAEALEAHRSAVAIRQRLVDANPTNRQCRVDLGWGTRLIGDLLVQTGKLAEALEAYGRALSVTQKLADTDPGDNETRDDMARCYDCIGRVHAREQRFVEALTAIDTGLTIRQKLVEAHPGNTRYAGYLGVSYAYRGAARARAGQSAEAAADLRRAVELCAKKHAPVPDDNLERSRALALLAGLGEHAKAGVTKDEAARFAVQAVASLRDAFNAFRYWPDELKDPDFDALRGRDDFRKLVAELEAKSLPKAEPRD